jgi:hypothetical protein
MERRFRRWQTLGVSGFASKAPALYATAVPACYDVTNCLEIAQGGS